ncbi:MAG: hypothetical protein AMXMBFR13_15510 [Phycisphaerae bacterium]
MGIYNRSWGAARHDTAAGVHRPMAVSVMAIREHSDSPPLVLAEMDGGWWQLGSDEWFVRGALVEELGLDPARVMLGCTHTHAGSSLCTADADKPGGQLIRPYVERIRAALLEATREAITRIAPGVMTWGYGRCDLATNRDLPEPDGGRIVCGYNPGEPADDTLLVGRVTDASGGVLATLVNYACHPTTLAWDNKLLSPDYVGAMREVVERDAGGLCLFLQGASGQLSPREQYVGDTAIADANGRRLGYAVLAVLEGMLPPKTMLEYAGVVESGAPLATWRRGSLEPSSAVAAVRIDVPLPLKVLPEAEELERELAVCSDRTMAERIRRKLRIVRQVGPGPDCPMPAWIWRVGQALFVGQPNETYSHFQLALRGRFPDHAVVVMNLVNGSCGYLSPPELYDLDIYQVWQSPFDRPALARLIDACSQQLTRLVSST